MATGFWRPKRLASKRLFLWRGRRRTVGFWSARRLVRGVRIASPKLCGDCVGCCVVGALARGRFLALPLVSLVPLTCDLARQIAVAKPESQRHRQGDGAE